MRRRLIGIVVKRARPETRRCVREHESGFTLIELLVTMGLVTILLTIGALSARQFWFQRSLTGGQDQMATQLQALQTRVVSDGVSGRYYGAWFDEGTDDWGTASYQSGTCTKTADLNLDANVVISAVDVATTAGGVDFSTAITTCRALNTIPDSAEFVWFLARGIATETDPTGAGSHILLRQPELDRTEEIRVYGLTSRVEKI